MYAILQIEIYEGTTGKARSRTLSTFIIMWSFRKYCIKCTVRNKSFPPSTYVIEWIYFITGEHILEVSK